MAEYGVAADRRVHREPWESGEEVAIMKAHAEDSVADELAALHEVVESQLREAVERISAMLAPISDHSPQLDVPRELVARDESPVQVVQRLRELNESIGSISSHLNFTAARLRL